MKKRPSSGRRPTPQRRSGKRQQNEPGGWHGGPPVAEWVGGRVLAPVFIGVEEPYRPIVELWMADGYILHVEIHDPNGPIPAVSEDLRSKLLDPPRGTAPRRLRLNDPGWAAQVRPELPGVDVISGPTPELDRPLDELTSHMAKGAPASYLDDRHSAEDMAALFTAADALYRVAPWAIFDDDQLIEVNIPELEVQGACLSIIGALGESFGMLLFESLADYERMLALSLALERTRQLPEPDIVMTSLEYERGADLPKSMRQEVVRYGWPVAAPAAYPVVGYRGRDGMARAVTPRELHIMTACAEALVAVLRQHRDAFAAGGVPHFSLSHVDQRGVEVCLKSPPAGREYDAFADRPTGLAMLDETLLVRLFDYAHGRWGRSFTGRVDRLIADQSEVPLILRVGAYHLAVDDYRTVAACFLAERAAMLDEPQRRLLAAQQAAWVSLWKVGPRVAGEGLELSDLLTGDTCWYANPAATDGLPEGSLLLARVVRCDNECLLSAHPVVLTFAAGAEVARRMLGYLRTRLPVAPERLRQPNSVRYLLKRWQDMIATIQGAKPK